jgi:hypothetical protein
MGRTWWRWVLAGLAGLGLGIGSAVAIARGALGDSSVTNGGWSTNLTIGSEVANPWVRARVALVGLLALNKSETIYFDRKNDDSGAPLRADCTYALSGRAIPARWWSITLYDGTEMLARNGDDAPSLDVTRLGTQNWVAQIAPQRPGGDGTFWLSSRNAGAFSLTLRLYNPQSTDPKALTSLALPRVNLISCTGKGASQ